MSEMKQKYYTFCFKQRQSRDV